MGCTASKLEKEDTVRRCKERRRLMRDAVQSRHHLASAHSDYLRSLISAGSALSRFAHGQPLFVSQHTPPIVLFPHDHSSSRPPPTQFAPSPSPSPSPTMASSKMPHILSGSSVDSTPSFAAKSTAAAAPPPPPDKIQNQNQERYATAVNTAATYPGTPSQASSVWDWENFYPPSPPDSEFFNRIEEEREKENQSFHNHHLKEDDEEDGDDDDDEEKEREQEIREKVHCSSERGGDQQHHSTSSSTSSIRSNDEDDENCSRSDGFAARSDFGAGSEYMSRPSPSEIGSSVRRTGRRNRSETGSSSAASGLKMVARHCDLAEIVAALEEYFVKSAGTGGDVSDILETGREQLDRSFRQLKKTVYHSNSVLSALSSTWSSKPPLAIKYRLDTGALEDSGGGKSLGSTLERLLAWEKKLYEEVKARDGVRIEHEKKLSTLQSLEYKGKDDAKIDRTKASMQKLQSLILVTSQAVATTSVAITKVRDSELAPQLVNLCYSLLSMWRSINQFHEVQNHIVQQVRGLVNHSTANDSTSDLHRVATRDLEAAVSSWHSNFNRLIKYQREFVQSLYGWLKLTLIHVGNNDDNHYQNEHSSRISVKLTAFCDEWKQALGRLPDTVASEAIKSFVNVVHVVYTKQEEELRVKKRMEAYSKELDKKSTALRAIEKKFYQSYSTVGIGISGNSDGRAFDSRDPLADKKLEIAACRRKVEDEMTKHAKAVGITRSMTLNNIQTGLPGVFQAMAGFSGMFAEAMEGVCRRADLVI